MTASLRVMRDAQQRAGMLNHSEMYLSSARAIRPCREDGKEGTQRTRRHRGQSRRTRSEDITDIVLVLGHDPGSQHDLTLKSFFQMIWYDTLIAATGDAHTQTQI